MKNIVLISFIVNSFISYNQGIKFDKEKYENLKEYTPSNNQGYASATLPSKISYRAYCPPVLSQGQLATCVGWATSYAQLTTQQNILMGESNPTRKEIRVMDPNFVYAMIRDYNDGWCSNGTHMWEALEVILNYGAKPYLTPPWLSCNSTYEIDKFAIDIASMYSAESYSALIDKSNLVTTLKSILNDKKVISAGISITPSFTKGTGILYGKWSPNLNEQIEGGHAMCIVGYDDTKYGGSFELMNSYGTNFGDNGFVWISYKDIVKYLDEAYVLELNTSTTGYRKGNCSFGDCYTSYSRYKYSNGQVYEGEFRNGYKHGWGTILYADNSIYIGNFTNGYQNGWGIVYLPNTGNYYKTFFNYGVLKSKENYQGFSGSVEDKKLDNLINKLQGIKPGKLVDMNSDAYQEFVDSSLPQEEPVPIKQE